MRLRSNQLGYNLIVACLLSVFALLISGCQTTSEPEPAFLDYSMETQQDTPQPEDTEAAASAESEQVEPKQVDSKATGPARYSDKFRVGDVVTVTFSGTTDPIQPHQERIKEDGTITLFLVGSVQAADKSPGELQKELQKDYERFYKTLVVTVQSFQRYFFVGGEVKREGAIEYLGETTVTQAIQAAGGFTDFAKKSRIQVIRTDGTKLTVNFAKVLDRPRLDPPVYPGDSIHVPRRIF